MKNKIIFFGNGPLAEAALKVFEKHFDVIFQAHTKDDLEIVKKLKTKHPDAHGILASFGVIIKEDILELFEPEGILNIHPSLLPKYRGASPIETAILNGDNDFSVSIMKLAKNMDAGPIYYQETCKGLPLDKCQIYQTLAKVGANWLVKNIDSLPTPTEQNHQEASFTVKLDKTMSKLNPSEKTANQILREIVAFQHFPKPKTTLLGQECIIISAHVSETPTELALLCKDQKYVAIDFLQPADRKIMDAKSFLNGYNK